MVTGLSSDAHYAITTDDKDYAILWDIAQHKKYILSHDADAYSAYWIKHTSYYMWQNYKTKIIHITNVTTGKDIRTLHPSFIVFGQAMSADLKYNVASDKNWNIWVGKGHQLKRLAWHFNNSPGFYSKLINFTFLGNDHLLASGFGDYDSSDLKNSVGINLWDLKTRQPIQRYLGNMVQTFATISPDGKYVVAGDANGANLYVWNTNTGKRIYEGVDIYLGKINTYGSSNYHKWSYDKSKLISMPKAFKDDNPGMVIMAIKFIDKTHYLAFYGRSHYAILYSVKSPWPIKYLDLGTSPLPALTYFERDQSIDTSPSKHILVMAKEHHSGILVYQYNPKTQTLKKVWDAS